MTTPDERPDLPTTDAPAAPAAPTGPAASGPAGPAVDAAPAAVAGRTGTQGVSDPWRRLDQRAEAFGHDIEDAAARFSASPGIRSAGDAAARLWGVVLLAAGLWLFARITFHLAVPDISWDLLGPGLVVILGVFVILRAGRRE